ncbi:MAG TPA: cytidine deaminase [Bellilinea sp.]|nr:cytidine deaminase [Bellilinea sp.]
MEFTELLDLAYRTTNRREFSPEASGGGVGCALEAESGRVYTGINIDTACSMGFCAEHSAVAAMVTAGENVVRRIVSVNYKGQILPPCGRCREFLSQVSVRNMDAEVMVASDKVVMLRDLIPYHWRDFGADEAA